MPKFVTALFEESGDARKAIDALVAAGFGRSDIQYVDAGRADEGFFERLFIDENGGDKERSAKVLGIRRRDVGRYDELVRRGCALVIAMCDENRADEAEQILGRFPVVRLEEETGGGEMDRIWHGAGEESESQTEWATPKWFKVVDVVEEDPDRGARSHAVHVRPKRHIHHIASDELPGAHRSRRFKQLESDFRVHYAENFADSSYSFDDLGLGYRYGMALAENRGLQDRDWESIEEHARRGWMDHTTRPWSLFKEAVRFGWRRVRSEQRREKRRQEEGRWSP